MKIRDLLNLVDLIHKKHKTSTPYICGGLPRDRYLKRLSSVADIDITTGDKTVDTLSLELFKFLKSKYNIKREVKSDGHSSIYFNNMKIDFSSNYMAPNIDKLLFDMGIKNPTSLQKESFSRDFGCNSMLLSLNFNQILDPTSKGIADCDNKVIKTMLSPEVTFSPNKNTGFNNRAIRSIYLACKLDFTIDNQIIEYISKNPQIIEQSEPTSLAKKLNSSYEINANKTIYYLNKMNLWNYIPISNMLSDEVLNLLSSPKNFKK